MTRLDCAGPMRRSQKQPRKPSTFVPSAPNSSTKGTKAKTVPGGLVFRLIVAQVRDLAVDQNAGLPLVLAVAATHAHVAGGPLPAGEAPSRCLDRPLHHHQPTRHFA